MKFLLDENVPHSIKNIILNIGYDVKTLKDLNKLGITNGEVAEIALNENAIIITFDSDFLSLKNDILLKSRIIYLDLHPRNPKVARELIEKNLNECINILSKPGKIIIKSDTYIFKKPLEK